MSGPFFGWAPVGLPDDCMLDVAHSSTGGPCVVGWVGLTVVPNNGTVPLTAGRFLGVPFLRGTAEPCFLHSLPSCLLSCKGAHITVVVLRQPVVVSFL